MPQPAAMPQSAWLPNWEVELLVRCVFAALLAGVALLGIGLPTRMPKESRVMPVANAFGGGVILSAALVHMLPEASECAALGSFPWAQTMLAAGYLFLLSVEISVDRFSQASSMHSLACCRPPLLPVKHASRNGSPLHVSDDSDEPYTQVETGCHLLEQQQREQQQREQQQREQQQGCIAKQDSCARFVGIRQKNSGRPLAGIAATCGLSVHALLEGLALGLRSGASDFAVISAIICVHKVCSRGVVT
jgi:zinc transporter ZupT